MKIEHVLNQAVIGEKEVDFYVPIKVEFKDNDDKDKELFYYRMLNSKSSFVEMSINSVTKKIVNITLVSVNDVKEMMNEVEHLNISKETGNPVIDMECFSAEHIVTDNVNFAIIKDTKKIYVLQDSIEVCRRLIMDSVELLLDSHDNIVGFIFSNFSNEEWQELTESINSSVDIALQEEKIKDENSGSGDKS
ncbi:hypothetical protein [Listeria costaricensis]|uniref:hypothetical protein n=1 Tax=Listeria costaricensis TaxID=2026604 RepID=UPI000C077D7F|nr:hypothetical protein [Listeria costaricensis]